MYDRIVAIEIDDYPNPDLSVRYRKLGVGKLYSFPLKSPEGIIGAITMAFTEQSASTLLDETFLYHLGEQIGMVLQNALLYKRLDEMAHTDPLTRLLNRRRMKEKIEEERKRAARNGGTFTLAMADLDNFKSINDTRGHGCGDEVLIGTADFFRRECRETDIISRWGGEEFLFLFLENDLEEAKLTAERLRSHKNPLHRRHSDNLQHGPGRIRPGALHRPADHPGRQRAVPDQEQRKKPGGVA